MNFAQVEATLEDVPSTFKRPSNPYLQLQDSFTAAITRGASATDEISNQVQAIGNAQFGWVDCWGLLFGIQRITNEPDQHYITRIQYEVLAGAGPPVGIADWLQIVWNISVTITENFPTVGYTIQFPPTLTNAQLITIINSMVRVRPAGVPFSVAVPSDGPYVSTVNFLNAARTTGAYVGGSAASVLEGISAATNNAQPLLPDLLLTDPVLNGQVL